MQVGALTEPSIMADDGRDAIDLAQHPRFGGDEFVVRLGDVGVDPVPARRQLYREIAAREGPQRGEQLPLRDVRTSGAGARRGGAAGAFSVRLGLHGGGRRHARVSSERTNARNADAVAPKCDESRSGSCEQATRRQISSNGLRCCIVRGRAIPRHRSSEGAASSPYEPRRSRTVVKRAIPGRNTSRRLKTSNQG
ncbi:hypothetical protein [Vulcanimicrobium alpinum]|uniref:hypothetical protein n=1 Tax=Vulcanimicrobium alpinum TaxID=3016050 RepID=UPI00295E9414|nr:hypothetical protein [Vulcanimicrobium alpinum]